MHGSSFFYSAATEGMKLFRQHGCPKKQRCHGGHKVAATTRMQEQEVQACEQTGGRLRTSTKPQYIEINAVQNLQILLI